MIFSIQNYLLFFKQMYQGHWLENPNNLLLIRFIEIKYHLSYCSYYVSFNIIYLFEQVLYIIFAIQKVAKMMEVVFLEREIKAFRS